ncbi:MAG TPA: monofunctional biosynthetic peptidoglycan transglycosylase [Syntrophorhabdales bacterium]|nr:monofunctional biosynthetic peptidoglycan transglycosylase [Syntrophorhabdales bacterium]
MARKKKKHRLFRLIKILFVLVLLALVGFVGYYAVYPDVSRLKRENPRKTSFIEYREREWKRKGKKVVIQKKWIPLGRISPYLVKAVLIAEDDKFWSHEGFDFDAIQKAIEKDLKAGKFKVGGSTVSQQLVKNLYLTPTKNPVRKLEEAIITFRVERNLSKRRILELYLNVVEWGEGIFGIEAASLYYYGKSAEALSAEEASRLAAVLPNPLKYKVKGASAYVEKRASLIYAVMVKRGIAIPEYEELNEPSEKEAVPEPSQSQVRGSGEEKSPDVQDQSDNR